MLLDEARAIPIPLLACGRLFFDLLAKNKARWTEDDLNKLGWRNAAAFYSKWPK